MLEAGITRVQIAVQAWAVRLRLQALPRPCRRRTSKPTLLVHEGHFYGEPKALDVSLSVKLKRLGYWYENLDGTTILIYADNTLDAAFADYFHWQWGCSLIKEDTADIYQELYEHFVRRPDDLHHLS
jgi:hypothetical protein